MKGIPLRLDHVSRTYRRGEEVVQALEDVSLTLYPGQLTLILGPSGGGKSSLLHVLGGMDRPNAGQITTGNTEITSLSADKLAQWRRRTVGFVFQSFYLLPGQTAVDNTALPLLLDGAGKRSRRDRASAVLRQFGLEGRLQHTPAQLSGGQIQRVAIARALAHDPPIILADEPTGNLDTESGRDVMEQLSRLAHEDGRTVVVVSHNEEYVSLADRVVRIRDGHIAADSLETPPDLDEERSDPPRGARRGPRLTTLLIEAVRSLNRRRGRSLLTSLGVIIGVTSMVLLISIGAGLKAHVIRSILGNSSLTAITVSPNSLPTRISFTPQVTSGPAHPINSAALARFRRIAHVKAAYGTTSFLVSFSTAKGSTTAVVGMLPPSRLHGVQRPQLAAGSPISARRPGLEMPQSMITALFSVSGKSSAKALGHSVSVQIHSAMGAGGAITAAATRTVHLPLTGVLKNGFAQYGGYVNYGTGQRWLKASTTSNSPVTYTNAVVYAATAQDVHAIANAIRAKGYGVVTTESIIHQVGHGFTAVETALGVVGGIALAVAGLMIGVVMSMAVLERRRDIGIWRAVGARRRDVFAQFLIEAVAMGLFGGAVGDLLGWGLGKLGAHFMHQHGLFLVQPWLVLLGLAFGGGVAGIAGAIPANHAAQLSPVDALRNE